MLALLRKSTRQGKRRHLYWGAAASCADQVDTTSTAYEKGASARNTRASENTTKFHGARAPIASFTRRDYFTLQAMKRSSDGDDSAAQRQQLESSSKQQDDGISAAQIQRLELFQIKQAIYETKSLWQVLGNLIAPDKPDPRIEAYDAARLFLKALRRQGEADASWAAAFSAGLLDHGPWPGFWRSRSSIMTNLGRVHLLIYRLATPGSAIEEVCFWGGLGRQLDPHLRLLDDEGKLCGILLGWAMVEPWSKHQRGETDIQRLIFFDTFVRGHGFGQHLYRLLREAFDNLLVYQPPVHSLAYWEHIGAKADALRLWHLEADAEDSTIGWHISPQLRVKQPLTRARFMDLLDALGDNVVPQPITEGGIQFSELPGRSLRLGFGVGENPDEWPRIDDTTPQEWRSQDKVLMRRGNRSLSLRGDWPSTLRQRWVRTFAEFGLELCGSDFDFY